MPVLPSFCCTECGAEIPDRALLGLCPACALRSALCFGETTEGFNFLEGNTGALTGNYELLEEIGRGGMGVVFRARQKSLNRIVAVKVMCGGLFVDPAGHQRLLAEAAAAGRLRHRHIVTVHEAGEIDGHAFYAMDFIAGRTLADVLRTGSVPPERAAEWLQKIATAVHYAHTQNVLHRDLKPSNVLLDENDEPRITDFGLAKILDSPRAATLTGSVFGSPAYMPPEQAAGRTDEIGPASDVYSLGAMLYELLTGRPPFLGTSPQEVIELVKTTEPVPPRFLNASLPVDLETVTLKCLQKNPAQRYATALELADELACFLDGKPIRARPVSAPEKIWRWARRHPSVATLAGISLGLLLAIVTVVAVSAHRVRISRDEAQARLAESLFSEAHALRLAGEPGWRETSLRRLAEAHQLDHDKSFTFQLRAEAIAALGRPDLTRQIVTNVPPLGSPMNACFDRTFTRVAIWNPQTRGVEIRRVIDGQRLTTIATRKPDEIHAFNADGKFLLLRHGGEMSVWNTANGALVISGKGSESHRNYDGGEFSPDGKRFGRCETNGQFVIYDLGATPPVPISQWPLPDGLVCATVAWSADGKSLALVLGDRTLALCDAASGTVRWQRHYSEMIWNITWENARDWLVLQSGDDRVLMLRPDDGSEIDHLNLTANGTPIARLSPDGNLLAVSGERFGTQIFDAATRRKLAGDPAPAWHLQFDESGTQLGSQLDQGRPLSLKWRPPIAQRTWHSRAQLDINESLAFSRDGRWLASLTGGGPIVREVATGKIIARVPLEKTRAVAFDSRNDQLLCLTDTALFEADLQEKPEQLIFRPRRLLEGKKLRGLTQTADGQLAVGDETGSIVHLLGAGNERDVPLPVHPLHIALSPNDRWLACGAYLDENLYVFDTTHPNQPPVKLAGAGKYGLFSPDGKKLFTFGYDIRVWSVGDWRPLPDLPADSNDAELILATISRDGRWLAVTQRDREVKLIVSATGRTVATLDGPGEGGILALAFSPDGNTLVIARDRGDLQFWSLPVLRSELRKLDLDW